MPLLPRRPTLYCARSWELYYLLQVARCVRTEFNGEKIDLLIVYVDAKLGLGWGNSLLAFIALAMTPLPFFFIKYGEHIRTKYKVQL